MAAFSRPGAGAVAPTAGAGAAGAPRKAGFTPSRHSRDAAPFAAGERSERNAGNPCATRGFTLVELIVVIVILAILAAIAIPALTGYIERAKWDEKIMQVRTQKIAVQTMIDLQYAEDGGFAPHDYTSNPSTTPSGEQWLFVGELDAGAGYRFSRLTQDGLASYVELTGDTQTLGADVPLEGKHGRPYVYTDRAGAIKVYQYINDRYFPASSAYGAGQLQVFYVENMDSPDAATLAFLAFMGTEDSNLPGMLTSGFSMFHRVEAPDGKFTKLR
jgi:prepilin-type N-terminal cleavage/methylation domain-containing protein